MSDPLSDLLESGRETLQHFGQTVDAGRQDVAALDEFIGRGRSELTSRGPAAVNALRTLLESVRQAEQKFEDQHRQNISHLESAEARLHAVSEELIAGDGEANQFLDELRERVDHAQHASDERLTGVHTDLDELKAKIQQLREQVQHVKEETQSQASALQEQVEAAVDALQNRQEELVEKFQSLADDVTEKLEGLSSAFDAAHESMENRLGDGLQELDTRIDRVEEALTGHLENSALKQIESSAEKLCEAIDALQNVAEAGGAGFTDDLDSVLEKVDQIIDLIKKIEPILERAKELAG